MDSVDPSKRSKEVRLTKALIQATPPAIVPSVGTPSKNILADLLTLKPTMAQMDVFERFVMISGRAFLTVLVGIVWAIIIITLLFKHDPLTITFGTVFSATIAVCFAYYFDPRKKNKKS